MSSISRSLFFQDSGLIDDSIGEKGTELLVLSVDLGDGRNRQLVVHENDNPEMLAIEFCQTNLLGPSIKIAICDEIEKLLLSSESKHSESSDILTPDHTRFVKKVNIGHDLYTKGVKMKQKLEINNKKLKEIMVREEMKHFTYKPETNSPIRRKDLPERILLEKGKIVDEKLERKRSEKEIRLMSECTFTPELNKNSLKINSGKQKSPLRFEELYNDAQNIREKVEQRANELILETCPFEPNLDLTRKKTEVLIKKKIKPICINDHYSLSPKVFDIKKTTPSYESNARSSLYSTGKSERLVQRVKKNRYQQIFHALLPDLNGYISKETVYKTSLPSNIKIIIKPLIDELEKLDETLDFNEFSDSMDLLMKAISPAERSCLLQTSKQRLQPEKYDFTPKINGKQLFKSPLRVKTQIN